MGRATAICDAIAADLEANVSLPDHRTHLYDTPNAMAPERCPALAVVVTTYPRRILATEALWEHDIGVIVAWYEAAGAYGETAGGTDSAMPGRSLDIIVAIGNTEINSVREFEAAVARLDKTKPIPVLLRRGDLASYLLLRPARG